MKRHTRKAQSLALYVLLLMAVFFSVTAMNTYLKRSVQAKIKDLSDAIIAPESEHITTADTNYISEAYSRSDILTNDYVQEISFEGVIDYNMNQKTTIHSEMEVVDPTDRINTGERAPSSEGTDASGAIGAVNGADASGAIGAVNSTR